MYNRNVFEDAKTLSSNLAFLKDRIAVRKGQEQTYGSSIEAQKSPFSLKMGLFSELQIVIKRTVVRVC
jgi:hypothetical protein